MADGRLNITDSPYSADNSGFTDCTDKIQTAINHVTNSTHVNYGRAIYFPPGTYLVTLGGSPTPFLSVAAGNKVTLVGAGREQTVLRMYPSTTSAPYGIYLFTPSQLTLRDLTVEEEYPNALLAGQYVRIIYGHYPTPPEVPALATITLDEVRIRGDLPMKVHNPYLVRATGCVIEGVSVQGVHLVDAFTSLPAGSASFERCDIAGPNQLNCHGVYAAAGDALMFRECRFTGGQFGLHIWGGSRPSDHVIVDGCAFYTLAGIVTARYSPTIVSNCAFNTTSEGIPSQKPTGIQVNGPLTVTNCTFVGAGGSAIARTVVDQPIQVVNCDFRGAFSAVVSRPVELGVQYQRWSFSHCRFENTGTAGIPDAVPELDATLLVQTGPVIVSSCDFRGGAPYGGHLRLEGSGEVIFESCTVADRPIKLGPTPHPANGAFVTGDAKATLVACRFAAANPVHVFTPTGVSVTVFGRDNEFIFGATVSQDPDAPNVSRLVGSLQPRPGRGPDVASNATISLPLSENQVRITGTTTISRMVPGNLADDLATCRLFQGPWHLIGLQATQIVAGGSAPGAFAYVRSGTVAGEVRTFILVEDPAGTFAWHEV